MSFGSLVRCAVISTAAPLLFVLVSVSPARPAPRDGDDPIDKAVRRRPADQPAEYEIPPHPIDLAPNAKRDPALAKCIELRAWADKVEFRQLEPVEIHYEYENTTKDQVLIISGTPNGAYSLEVEVATAGSLMPKTRYATVPRMARTQNWRGMQPFRLGPLIKRSTLGYGAAFTIKGTMVVNLLRDMSNPGRYEVTLILPVYNRELTAKAEARSIPVTIVVKRPES